MLNKYNAYILGPEAQDSLTKLAARIRDMQPQDRAHYSIAQFRNDAVQAVIQSTDYNHDQAVCIVSGALDRRQAWTDAHDFGNLIEEINWYVILVDSVNRNG